MAHFAKLDLNNKVIQVIVVSNDELLDDNGNESEAKGIEFCRSLLGGNWVQTSYNNRFRKNYASVGFTYDPIRDAFIPPKQFPSWTLNEQTCRWEAPIPVPPEFLTGEKFYFWSEKELIWKEVPPESTNNAA